MIPFLIAAISAQLSTPLNLNGQAITRASCDGGIVCTKTGQTLTITWSERHFIRLCALWNAA